MPDPTYGWVTLAEANTFFSTRFGADDYWISGADKDGALTTAYNWLVGCGKFGFPTTATQAMKDAQCEMALFLIQHQPDIDLRMGLQAQGVIQAGIVKETYSGKAKMPIPPLVCDLLTNYSDSGPIHYADIERDEEYDTTYDAPGNLDTVEDTHLT